MSTSLSGLGTRRRRSSLPILSGISTLLLLAAVGLFVFELVSFTDQQERLPAEVSVAGIPVGDLMPGEAVARIEERLVTQPLTLWYDESPIRLDPAAVGFRVNSQAMIAEARSAGEANGGNWLRFVNYLTGRIDESRIQVPLAADYQQGLLEQFLQEISLRYDRSPGGTQYDLQTLTLSPGAGGYTLDVQQALPLVERALFSPDDRSVNLPVGQTGPGATSLGVLRDMIIDYLSAQGFAYNGQTTTASVYILDLQTGEEINLLGDVAYSAASTIKLPILIDYYRYLSLPPDDDEAFLMANSLLCSNNSSSNLLMQIIGGGTEDSIFNGIASVTNTAQYLGASNTYITAPLFLGVEDQQLGSIAAPPTSPNPNFDTGADPFNQTTAEDLGALFTMIYDCANYGSGLMAAYPDGEFTQNECRQMIELMSANDLLRLLQGGIPADVRISHKNGWLQNVHGDAGIVYPPNGRDYVIAVFVWEEGDFFSFTRAWPLIEGVSRAAWNYFVPEDPMIAPRTDLPLEAQECEGNYRPPYGEVNMDDINAWRN
jgi:hypothetical protein